MEFKGSGPLTHMLCLNGLHFPPCVHILPFLLPRCFLYLPPPSLPIGSPHECLWPQGGGRWTGRGHWRPGLHSCRGPGRCFVGLACWLHTRTHTRHAHVRMHTHTQQAQTYATMHAHTHNTRKHALFLYYVAGAGLPHQALGAQLNLQQCTDPHPPYFYPFASPFGPSPLPPPCPPLNHLTSLPLPCAPQAAAVCWQRTLCGWWPRRCSPISGRHRASCVRWALSR